ncbi:TIGR02217 family protein [Novosphingobium sp.]|uniref:phage distal tail protein, Rcc01695 family n=1 Tax=Novosphingobium sp. TaxID=1874826 RepID=UPI00261FDA35|nr:TIGR02217 family protein [Novosphingobium sp.]
MAFWLARARSGQDHDWIQRFDPRFWTVNFPRPMMAAATVTAPDTLRIDLAFLTRGDLAGVIWESADRFDHPLLAYATDRDYARTTLSFRWRSAGVIPLDAGQGPTLTIEGRDAGGSRRTWYVRLWNYRVSGGPEDARIVLPFSALHAGWSADDRSDPVHPGAIDRLFISLVPPGYGGAGTEALSAPVEAWAELSELRCDGARAMLEIGDVLVPPHGLACATAFDDQGTQTPQRVLRNVEGLGYRGSVLHYVGMSHFMRLAAKDGAFTVDPLAPPLCAPAAAWHAAFLAEARTRGLAPILSLSFELLARHCPEAWQQRAADGTAARTGWAPPSALLSPAHPDAMAWLGRVAAALARLMRQAGVAVRVQIGEPWWWIDAAGRPCLYDAAARGRFGGNPPVIADCGAPLDAAQRTLLDQAGAVLAEATAALRDAIRAAVAPLPAEVLLLVFLPGVLDPARPEVRRANLPPGWAAPAYDRLQLEDYDWLTAGADALREQAHAAATARLGYPATAQDYLAGFVLTPDQPEAWRRIDSGCDEALARGAHEVFVWALPQICRDGFVRLPPPAEEDPMQAFDDVPYPLALGRDAVVAPEFSTSVTVTASGFERRNALWSDARLRFDLGPGIRSAAELAVLLAFFRARRGAARGFRLRDPIDFSSNGMTGTPTALDQWLGTGDGVTTRFALVKRYGDDDPQERRITRPVPASLRVSVGGQSVTEGWSLAPGGIVRFVVAPANGAEIRAGFLFDVPVRFAQDRLELAGHGANAGEVASVPVIEVREAA